ncbi:MAG TPA: hypothetical protein PKV16_06810 [Caldisericia bacterium]|nr:hypothetical protein [Caldisericia bacterium]HPF49477.1 hypothetical protein [Caldisericia bacterium]HPI84229.1 hypothetical protein [Caldisericia bacterium]HPQ93476.1 hypothetical protein [Caldisericia bacterium]HRV75518.1 hypothetical protein [Caldisericia bacterium]
MKKRIPQIAGLFGGAIALVMLFVLFNSMGWLSLDSFTDVTQGTLSAPGSIAAYTIREAVESCENIGHEMIMIDGVLLKEDPVDYFLQDDTGLMILEMGSLSSISARDGKATVYGTLTKRGNTDVLLVDKIDYRH